MFYEKNEKNCCNYYNLICNLQSFSVSTVYFLNKIRNVIIITKQFIIIIKMYLLIILPCKYIIINIKYFFFSKGIFHKIVRHRYMNDVVFDMLNRRRPKLQLVF